MHLTLRRFRLSARLSWIARARANCMAVFALLIGSLAPLSPAFAVDPAITFLDRAAKEAIAATRTRSPSALQTVIQRYADAPQIGLYALGDYRGKLEAADREPYFAGMIRFIGRYAATEAPKYPIARVTFTPEVRQTRSGITVDSTIVMQDGTSYDVAWLLTKYGAGYRIRDAQVMSFWLTSFLQKLFVDYIGQNNGSVKALVQVLQRH
jgi:phospholipid transport system substrate-binding protein